MTRIRAVRVPLTDEQRALIGAATGEDVREAVIAARVDHDELIEGEVVVADGGFAMETLENGTKFFINRLDQFPVIKGGYEHYTEHPIDSEEPAIALLR